MEKEVLEYLHKITDSIISNLENKNYDDANTMMDYGMNYDYYEGLINGREESIKLIKKAFLYEG